MPENIKWDAVFQSITDTWLPLFGFIAAIVVIVVVVRIVKKRRKK